VSFSSSAKDKMSNTKDVTIAQAMSQGEIPHKRSNSKIMCSINGKVLSSGSSFFDSMSRYQKQDNREELHLTRRRRISLQSSNSADDENSKTMSNDGAKRSDGGSLESMLSHYLPLEDIRKQFQVEDPTLSTDLPDPNVHTSPDVFLIKLVKVMCGGLELEAQKAQSLERFFSKGTDAQVEAYTTTVVSVVRNNDLEGLKQLQANGHVLSCINRFGESLLHMACRRGFEDIVEFLLDQPDVDVRICDDNGRTVLHDACWNPSPQIKICQRILQRDPSLFFITDNRGCSPFQYARPEHWGIWRIFLLDNREFLKALSDPDIVVKLAKTT
jgi:hypothetical protein